MSQPIKIIPSDRDIEISVLGRLMLDPEKFDQDSKGLETDCFYFEKNRKIFIMMQLLQAEGKIPEFGLLMGRLPNNSELLLMAEICTTIGLDSEISELIELKERRRLIFASLSLLETAYDRTEPFDRSEKILASMALSGRKNQEAKILRDWLPESIKKLESMSKGEIVGIKTGLVGIDSQMSGLQRGQSIVLAGRPAMGKTALASEIALRVLANGGTVAFYELEMDGCTTVNRAICRDSNVSYYMVSSGKSNRNTINPIEKNFEKYINWPLYLCDSPGMRFSEIWASAENVKAQNNNLDLIVIDNYQIIGGEGREKDRRKIVSDAAIQSKNLAKHLNVPVLSLSHLSRACEQREDKRPMLSDLKESGDIEQSADIVMFLYRDHYYNKKGGTTESEAEIIFGKNRNGPTGKVKIAWDPSLMGFENYNDNDFMSGMN